MCLYVFAAYLCVCVLCGELVRGAGLETERVIGLRAQGWSWGLTGATLGTPCHAYTSPHQVNNQDITENLSSSGSSPAYQARNDSVCWFSIIMKMMTVQFSNPYSQ